MIFEHLYSALAVFYEPLFMRRAMAALFLLSWAVSGAGVLAVSRRMAFFPDAVGHSVLAGLAAGVVLNLDPQTAVAIFGLLLGLMITFLTRRAKLASDTSLALVFSGAVALGLALISRNPRATAGLTRWLMGDILTVGNEEIAALLVLDIIAYLIFFLFYNRLILSAVFPAGLEKTPWADYLFGAFLAVVSVLAVQVVGVLLATALLVTPAATGRVLAASGRSFFWLALFFSLAAGQLGLWLSRRPEVNTATGATVVLVSLAFLALASLFRKLRGRI
ncbi:MAG: metal ABC transporter permease [Deltaproteobacteria bacterium]|jgi:zinc transport system permease protein|nr:metal ABC transporter permease [Deltaproteobacteria bacterium]